MSRTWNARCGTIVKVHRHGQGAKGGLKAGLSQSFFVRWVSCMNAQCSLTSGCSFRLSRSQILPRVELRQARQNVVPVETVRQKTLRQARPSHADRASFSADAKSGRQL